MRDAGSGRVVGVQVRFRHPTSDFRPQAEHQSLPPVGTVPGKPRTEHHCPSPRESEEIAAPQQTEEIIDGQDFDPILRPATDRFQTNDHAALYCVVLRQFAQAFQVVGRNRRITCNSRLVNTFF